MVWPEDESKKQMQPLPLLVLLISAYPDTIKNTIFAMRQRRMIGSYP